MEDVRRNASRIIGALTLQRIGDSVVDAKTVLPWLFTALGTPTGLIGLLVPLRESLSLLPQASLLPRVRRVRLRKLAWVFGAGGQAGSVAVMALVAATLDGTAAGVLILLALAAFALFRALGSIASKDVLGRTVPKGRRGRVTGVATTIGGAVAIAMGLAIRVLGGGQVQVGPLAWLLLGAAATWVVGAVLFATVSEPREPAAEIGADGWLRHSVQLLREDKPFRRFVLVRTLLLVSALSPPFVVSLASDVSGATLGALGPFVLASGVASLVSGWLWGGVADRSSRRAMMLGAGGASGVLLALLALLPTDVIAGTTWPYVGAYLLLMLAHTGARVGRKTYVVDLAEGNQRTDYVAVSNTAMGVLLLGAGGLSAALAQIGVGVALGFLAVLGLVGVLLATRLPEVSARA